jgi:phosphoglucosamine mutase
MSDAFFGTDGIRAAYGEGPLSPGNVHRIGRAIARFARRRVAASPRIFLARDTRESGPALLAGLAAGCAAEGVVPDDGGVMPTPAIAWWTATKGADVGVALTASHNPASDNGVKVILPGGRKAAPEEEAEIEAEIRALPLPSTNNGGVHPAPRATPRPDALEAYVQALLRHLGPPGRLTGLRLVVDCAGGATSVSAPRVLAALGATTTILNAATVPGAGVRINDGCGTEHPEAWRAAVVREKADGGLAFDGDGDRVLLADESGEILDGDPVLHLLARDLLDRDALPGRRVVATVMSNLGLERALSDAGISLERVPVGDRHVAARMRETDAALGGEQSGHVLLRFGDVLLGDGLVAGVLALEAARRRGWRLSQARTAVRRYPQILRNVRVSRRIPLEDLRDLSALIRAEGAALGSSGRVLVRYSGTEPVLRIMVEGQDPLQVEGAVSRLAAEAQRIR